MSLPSTVSVTCPKCGQDGQMTVWSSVNISLDPEMKEKILDQSLFRYTCNQCQHVSPVFFQCLYHDMETRTMVWMVEPDANTDEIQDALPPLPFATNDYRLRIVHSINELVEMVLLIDSGLNDLAVQAIKLIIMSNEDAPEGPWYFNGVEFILVDAIITFSSPDAGVSCQVTLEDSFDALSAKLAPFDRSQSWIVATPENVMKMLENSAESNASMPH